MKVAILFNELKSEASRWALILEKLLKSRKAQVTKGWKNYKSGSADFAVVLGGDGTMLRAARLVASRPVPLWGIRSGGLGFLTCTDVHEMRSHLKEILAGRFNSEERWLLQVQVLRKGRPVFEVERALNDCVIRSGDSIRSIALKAYCRKEFLAAYFGDGLIVATPTGSTAYAMAASGPIVDPRVGAFIVAPICPHTFAQRPLIVPSSDAISIEVLSDCFLALDGQVLRSLKEGDVVEVRRYEYTLTLLVPPNRSYFAVLRGKLKWGER